MNIYARTFPKGQLTRLCNSRAKMRAKGKRPDAKTLTATRFHFENLDTTGMDFSDLSFVSDWSSQAMFDHCDLTDPVFERVTMQGGMAFAKSTLTRPLFRGGLWALVGVNDTVMNAPIFDSIHMDRWYAERSVFEQPIFNKVTHSGNITRCDLNDVVMRDSAFAGNRWEFNRISGTMNTCTFTEMDFNYSRLDIHPVNCVFSKVNFQDTNIVLSEAWLTSVFKNPRLSYRTPMGYNMGGDACFFTPQGQRILGIVSDLTTGRLIPDAGMDFKKAAAQFLKNEPNEAEIRRLLSVDPKYVIERKGEPVFFGDIYDGLKRAAQAKRFLPA